LGQRKSAARRGEQGAPPADLTLRANHVLSRPFVENSRKRGLQAMRPERYNVRESEQKWQKAWADEAIFATRNDDPRP
jgi:hypothetical protein